MFGEKRMEKGNIKSGVGVERVETGVHAGGPWRSLPMLIGDWLDPVLHNSLSASMLCQLRGPVRPV